MTRAAPSDALLTPADAAAWLKVSRKSLTRYHDKGLRFVVLTSKTIRYRMSDLQAFIALIGEAKKRTA